MPSWFSVSGNQAFLWGQSSSSQEPVRKSRMIDDSPVLHPQYLLVCFFTGFSCFSHLSLSKQDPLLSRVVQSFHLLLGGNSLYRTISFLLCVKTIPLTRHNLLPWAAQALRQSEQTSHCSTFIPLVLLASCSVLPLLAVPHSAAFHFFPVSFCRLF